MSEQPTALRLARELEACPTINYKAHAAELRKLHEANEAFGKRQEWWNERMFVLEQQRDALLDALKNIEHRTNDPVTVAMAQVAIARAEENT